MCVCNVSSTEMSNIREYVGNLICKKKSNHNIPPYNEMNIVIQQYDIIIR